MRERILQAALLLLLMTFMFSLSTGAQVPHPLADYQIRDFHNEDAVRDKYTVFIQSEDRVHPWKDHSYVTLYSRELAETWATLQAYRRELMGEERNVFIKNELSHLDNYITFQLFLRSHEKHGHLFTNIVNFNPQVPTFEPLIARILLELDDGRIIEAIERRPGGSTVSGGNWRAFNSVSFPRADERGDPLITDKTQWVYLWLVTEEYRIYFPFYFQQ